MARCKNKLPAFEFIGIYIADIYTEDEEQRNTLNILRHPPVKITMKADFYVIYVYMET